MLRDVHGAATLPLGHADPETPGQVGLRCMRCGSKNHWANKCPEAESERQQQNIEMKRLQLREQQQLQQHQGSTSSSPPPSFDLTGQFERAAEAATPSPTGPARQYEGEALHARHLMHRMGDAASSLAPVFPRVPLPGSGMQQVQFDNMYTSSVAYKKQQATIENLERGQKRLSDEMQGVRHETADLAEGIQGVRQATVGLRADMHSTRDRIETMFRSGQQPSQQPPPPRHSPREAARPTASRHEPVPSRTPANRPSASFNLETTPGRDDDEAETEDEAEIEAGLELARQEAEAARQGRTRMIQAGAGYVASLGTPLVDFEYMPEPLRKPMSNVSNWSLNIAVHTRFSAFTRTSGNRKIREVAEKFETSLTIPFTRYADALQKLKSTLKQWQTRLIATGCPADAVLATRSAQDVLRLLALIFIHQTEAGTPFSADLSNKEAYIDEAYIQYMK